MSFAFNPQDRRIIVPTRVTGPSGDMVLRLALDTGASRTLLRWDALVVMGFDPAANEERVQITTGSGVEFVPQVRVNKIEALGVSRGDFVVVCHTLPPSARLDGLLGMDFFLGTRLTIDCRQGLVKLD